MYMDVDNHTRKANLLYHLSKDVYCDICVSKVDGVGVKSLVPIKKGVNPFVSNGLPNGKSIDLTGEEVNSLPKHVQSIIRKFIVPDDDKGKKVYAVPEGGLNNRDVSWYLNSAHIYKTINGQVLFDEQEGNVEFGSEHGVSGYTKMLTTRDIGKGSLLFSVLSSFIR
jgi:hypothetical protein